jgi:hypothetical protein
MDKDYNISDVFTWVRFELPNDKNQLLEENPLL